MSIKRYAAGSLVEYITIINSNNIKDFYFRGENDKFPKITSSIARAYMPKGISGLVDVYSKILSDYYQEVGYEIDRMQEKHFVAFSQHHGLKTNLIDFTTAPLVALYFSCDIRKSNSGKGYVYAIDSNSTVDASDYINEYSFIERHVNNTFGKMAKKEMVAVKCFVKLMEEYAGWLSGRNPFDFVRDISVLIQKYDFLEKCNEYVKKRLAFECDVTEMPGNILGLIESNFPEIGTYGNLGINEFVTLLVMFFNELQSSGSPYCELPELLDFPRIPYLMYKPPIKFDRIRNQSGVFLYQAFFDYITEVDKMAGIMIQEIMPDIVIEITNQREIMHELDMVGINRRMIYGDYDNTATYINEKTFQ